MGKTKENTKYQSNLQVRCRLIDIQIPYSRFARFRGSISLLAEKTITKSHEDMPNSHALAHEQPPTKRLTQNSNYDISRAQWKVLGLVLRAL
jgi:hypothetical protein